MKLSHFLSILLVSSVGFSGCSSSSNDTETSVPDAQATTTVIRGSTTLSSGYVCLDINNDSQCNASEEKVETEDDGSYIFEYEGEVAEGTQIIAGDGRNLILMEDNDLLAFVTNYFSENSEHNISTMTTLIANRVANGASYGDAKSYIADHYDLDESVIISDPIEVMNDENGERLFLTIRGMELGFVQRLRDARANSAPQRAADNTTTTNIITEEEADSALDEISDYLSYSVNEYSYRLGQYFIDIKNIAMNYVFDLRDDVLDGCYWDDNCTEDLNLPRAELNGAWYMWGLHSCIEIDADDNILLRTIDTNESYELYYREYNSEFTLLQNWEEQGLVTIVKDQRFYREGNNFNHLRISYNENEANLSLETNASVNYSMIKFSNLDACYDALTPFN